MSVLVLSACGKDTPTEDAAPFVTAAPSQPEALPVQPAIREPAPIATSAPPLTDGVPAAQSSPTPLLDSGSTAAARVSPRPGQEDVTTVEVVKLLTPAVVQIIT